MAESYGYECFQKTQLVKEMLLIENHLASFKCPHCLEKHRLTVQALAEETIKMTPHDQEKALLQQIINSIMILGAPGTRELRLKMQDLIPSICGYDVKEKNCTGKRCNLHI